MSISFDTADSKDLQTLDSETSKKMTDCRDRESSALFSLTNPFREKNGSHLKPEELFRPHSESAGRF
jgi:hypothetical protein